MTIGKLEKRYDKYQFRLIIEKCPPYRLGFAPHILFQYIRLKSLPPIGEMIGPNNYDGYMHDFKLPLPMIWTDTHYILPRWMRYFRRNRGNIISISYPHIFGKWYW